MTPMPEKPDVDVSPVSKETALVEPSVATTSHLVPGAPVETVADKQANDKVRAVEPVDPKVPVPQSDIDTSSPAANLASRSNIVADGPGTVADFLER